MSKPREWIIKSIDREEIDGGDVRWIYGGDTNGRVEVIEKSAYEALAAENATLVTIQLAVVERLTQERDELTTWNDALAAQLAEAKAEVAEYKSHLGVEVANGERLEAQLKKALKNVPNNYVHKQYHSQVVERLEKALAYAKSVLGIGFDINGKLEEIERLEHGE